MNNFKVKFISSNETMDLRLRILRPGQPRENCIYPNDDHPNTFHLAVVNEENKIICNGTFMQEAHLDFANSILPYRLRGMATDTTYQKQGLGRMIIEAAEVELIRRKCDLLWFNGRVSAEGFYKKLGYTSTLKIFDILLAGPHKIMFKKF
ncbi:MAG: GNAT family N-acetyltransferase [Pseudobdellovibrio sp.]